MAKKDKPAEAAPEAKAAAKPAGNTKRRALAVIRELDLSRPVAHAVLEEMGLKPISMVDPAQFKEKVTAWLEAPVGK